MILLWYYLHFFIIVLILVDMSLFGLSHYHILSLFIVSDLYISPTCFEIIENYEFLVLFATNIKIYSL